MMNKKWTPEALSKYMQSKEFKENYAHWKYGHDVGAEWAIRKIAEEEGWEESQSHYLTKLLGKHGQSKT